MSTTPPKRRAPARKPRAAMAPAEVIKDIVGDVSLDLVPQPQASLVPSASLMPASIDDAVDDIFQALMADDDGEPAVALPPAEVSEPAPKPARKRASRAKAVVQDAAFEAPAPGDDTGLVDAQAAPVVAEATESVDAADVTDVGVPKKRTPARKRGKAQLVEQDAAPTSTVEEAAVYPDVADGEAGVVLLADAQLSGSDDAADPAAHRPARRGSAGRRRHLESQPLDADVTPMDAPDAADADATAEDAATYDEEAEQAPPAKSRRKPSRPPVELISDEPDALPRFTLGSREDDGVFGDYELRDSKTAGTFRLRLLGRGLWRCDCAQYAEQGDCEHGNHLLSLFDDAQEDALDAGWPAREAEVWLVPGPERRLQWIAGREVPAALRDQYDLDERQRRDAEYSQAWLQSLVAQARAAGVTLRVDAPVWPQLAWGRDAQARVERLEAFMADGVAMRGLLSDTLPPHQWEAALFAVCAGRALVADDLGLGQRGAAIAAIRLWESLFGATPALVIAPESQHAAWRRDLTRWLGEGATKVVLAEQPTAKHNLALLVVDGIDAVNEEALAVLRALEVRTGAQLLLIAGQEPLSHPQLAAWVDWLDTARRGPFARFSALPVDAGKRAAREALEQIILSRRKRELTDRLPACLTTPLWLEAAGSSLPQGPLKQLRQTLERWQARPFLNSAEQQQLMEALGLLPPASRQALAAKAEAVLALRKDWVESPTPAASRLLVCSRSETLLDSLSQSPQLRRLPPHRLRAGDSDETVAQTLQAWRAAPAGVLLASDDALAALPEGLLADERVGVVHADLPWQAATLDERVALARGDDACGVPAAMLLISGSLDAGLSKAHAAGLSFPDWLDAPPAWLDQAQIEALMAVLPALLEGL